MTINPLGGILQAPGSASGGGIPTCAPAGVGRAMLGAGSGSLGNLTSELTSGLGDDASSMNMLSQLAATLGNLASNCTVSASASGGASALANGASAASGGITVPTPTSSGQQFRSYGSLQQAQQGGSNGDATLASLISGGASEDTDNA